VCAFLAQRAARLAAEQGDNPGSAATMTRLRAEATEHLVRINTLRRLAAQAKLPAALDWIGEFTASGEKLVVFAHHRDLVHALAERFGGLRIAGEAPPPARQAAVDRFQTDPQAQVVVCSIQAAGIGLTLTAASDVLFVEYAWTPAALEQAEDRCHRIGQHTPVTAWYTLAADTIDQDLLELVERKRAVVTTATDGDQPAGSVSVAGDLLERLTRRGLDANC